MWAAFPIRFSKVLSADASRASFVVRRLSSIGVAIAPGKIVLHRIFSTPKAAAACLDSIRTAPLLAWYAAKPAVPTRPPKEEILMMEPPPRRRIDEITDFIPNQVPVR